MPVVTYQTLDGVALITIDRPARKNTLDHQVVAELADAWHRFNDSEERAAVLTASGDAVFSAGADLDAIPHDLWRAIPGVGVQVDKPIVGAVAGWVVGGGLVLAQFCDLLVAAENTTFLYPEAKVGFAGGLISSLAARIPHKVAMELLLLGEGIDARRGYEVGLVNRVVPTGTQQEEALGLARKLAANAPLVLSLLKRFVGQTLPKGPSEAAAIARAQVDAVTASADFAEGLSAFREKRPPRFQGA